MEVWREQCNDALDQVADYAADWDEMLEMAAKVEADATAATSRSVTYLEYLVPRLRDMQRRMNRVYRLQTATGGLLKIENYSYDMYCWYLDRGFPEEAIQPHKLLVLEEWLTPDERDQFRSRIEPR